MEFQALNLGSLNLKVSPLLHKPGDMLRCINVDSFPYGAKRKRSGYISYLGTANGSAPTNLFSWTKDDGTTLFTYRVSGGIVYYSTQGTAAWTVCGNGTVLPSVNVPHAVLANTLFISQEGGTTRHSTDGTSFTDTSSAPAGGYMTSSRDDRLYIGSASVLHYSTGGSGTDWSTSGTSDSSTLVIPGAGGINALFFATDRIMIGKDSGLLYKWDFSQLIRVPTNQGPSSYQSLAELEDYWIWINRQGYQGFNGNRPELISNAVENQIFNDSGNGIVGTTFDSAPAASHKLHYYCAVGTVRDEITDQGVDNCIQRYNYQYNEWDNYKFNNFPSAFHSYKDENGVEQLIFGDNAGTNGQCYQLSGTATADGTTPIETIMEGVFHFGVPHRDKFFDRLWAFASPGCGAKVQVALSDSFNKKSLKWMEVGNLIDGIRKFDFPSDSRGKLLFWRLHEYSTKPKFTFYGFTFSYELIGE